MRKVVLFLFSPSRLGVEVLRNKCGDDKASRGNLFRRWNARLFVFEITAAAILCAVTAYWPKDDWGWVIWPLIIYAWSRINEIAFAFYQDAFFHLRKELMATNLDVSERVGMALKSYVGLAVNFGFLYFFLPLNDKFKGEVENYGDVLYFSFVTITTLGYGDIFPAHALTQALSIYEVLTGILVLVVAIATYIGGPSEPRA